MLYRKVMVFQLIIQIRIMQISSHTIDVQDTKVFEIALDDTNYDEENENEMIQPADLKDLKPLSEDENKYKPLHSHVKYYNEYNAEKNTKHFSNAFPYVRSHMDEIFNLEQEDKPFIAGFKHELDKTTIAYKIPIKTVDETSSNKNKRNMQNLERSQNHRNGTTNFTTGIKSIRVKRWEINNSYGTTLDKSMDFFQMIRNRNVTTNKIEETTEYFRETQVTHVQYEYDQETTSEHTEINVPSHFLSDRSTLADTESPDEELYDYEKFKAEYEQQLEYSIKHGKTLNYTEKEELEDTPRKALARIMDLKRPKNCTKEELSQIGIKAIECLIYDYQHTRDVATIRKVLSRTWLVLRIWLLIYICLAVPCWCQRGWCCCCFRCKFCFPQKRISLARQYYAINPPGTLLKDLKKRDEKESIRYEATEYEYDAYKTFETAIRNI